MPVRDNLATECVLEFTDSRLAVQRASLQPPRVYFFQERARVARAIVSSRGLALIPQMIVCQLAGGYAQLSIIMQIRESFWKILLALWTGQLLWRSSIFYICNIDGFRELITEEHELQFAGTTNPTSDQQRPETLPATIPHDSQGDRTPTSVLLGAVIFAMLFIVRVSAIVWLCVIVICQLFILVAPCAVLYVRIALETTSWKNMDPINPCPQLRKDSLEDELW